MLERVSSGNIDFDELLDGGYEADIVTMLYGGPGTGKTNICLMTAAEVSKTKKVIFIDTEGSFSVDRFKQLTEDFETCINNIFILCPTHFEEQKGAFAKLKELTSKKDIGMIIVDSIAMLYRLEIGKTKNIQGTNRELGLQISYLSEIARKKKIPVLITNQIYKDFENKTKINIVGGDILKYWSKCLIEIKKLDNDKRTATLKKHRSKAENKELKFKIINQGIVKED
jgi:DNA repair protein RadB